MTVIINPGSGPVPSTTEDNATSNMGVFTDDLRANGLGVDTFIRRAANDYGDGRYAYEITFADGRSVEVQMPGLPVDQVRFLSEPGQNIWDFPRLYVDDSSWVWQWALSACEPDEDEVAPPRLRHASAWRSHPTTPPEQEPAMTSPAVSAALASVALDAGPLIASALATDLAVTQVRFQYRSTGVIVTGERTDQLDAAADTLLDVFQAAGWGFNTRFATGNWIRVAIKFVHPSQLTLTGAPTPPFPPR